MRTVSSILKNARAQKNLTLREASRTLKIHPRFLKALEDGRYEIFSSAVHLKGFLKNYAALLGLDVKEILAFWRREYDEEKVPQKLKSPVRPLFDAWLVLTPGTLLTLFSLVLVLGFFAYLIFEYRSFAGAPFLEILEPPSDFKTNSSTVVVSGKTDKDATLTINGQKISLGREGGFSANIALSPGMNSLTFVAANKLGRSRKISRTIVVEGVPRKKPAEASSAAAKAAAEVEVKVVAGPEASWLEAYVGKSKVFEGVLLAGLERTFRGSGEVKIKSGNAGSIRIFVNGRDRGKMGQPGEVVEREFGL